MPAGDGTAVEGGAVSPDDARTAPPLRRADRQAAVTEGAGAV